jgi:hypothetical protein
MLRFSGGRIHIGLFAQSFILVALMPICYLAFRRARRKASERACRFGRGRSDQKGSGCAVRVRSGGVDVGRGAPWSGESCESSS